MASLNFDIANIDLSTTYELIPDGEYEAVIVGEEFKATKAGTGSYLSLKIEIISGMHKGRFLFDILNLNNPNPKAVEIAKQTLAKISLAIGKPKLNDSSELLNTPMIVKVGKQESEGYEPQNKIKNYKKIGAEVASTNYVTQQQPAQLAQQIQQTQPTKRPWEL